MILALACFVSCSNSSGGGNGSGSSGGTTEVEIGGLVCKVFLEHDWENLEKGYKPSYTMSFHNGMYISTNLLSSDGTNYGGIYDSKKGTWGCISKGYAGTYKIFHGVPFGNPPILHSVVHLTIEKADEDDSRFFKTEISTLNTEYPVKLGKEIDGFEKKKGDKIGLIKINDYEHNGFTEMTVQYLSTPAGNVSNAPGTYDSKNGTWSCYGKTGTYKIDGDNYMWLTFDE